jgi:uncharacterized protein (DUF2062 family)
MFRRREKLSLRSKIGGIFWPRIGWKRAGLYYWYRLHRMEGTSRSIASGLAFGIAAAMTPFYGLHTIVAIALAWVFGANMVAAAVGTFANNPWTAPPLWFGTYYAGAWFLGRDTSSYPDFVRTFQNLTVSVFNRDMDMFAENIWPVLKPMAIGSIPFALVTGFVTYVVLEPIIRAMHLERALRFAKHKPHPQHRDHH